MKGIFYPLALLLSLAGSDTPRALQVGGTDIGQSAADDLREFAGAEVAFLPADLLGKPLQRNNLFTILSYPSEGVVVLSLSGAQIKSGLERSIMMYPDPNAGFLQISGIEVSFSKTAVPNSRVTAVTLNGSKLEDGKKYEVAMPTSLQEGQLGYSDIWDKAKVSRNFLRTSIGNVLEGKHPQPSASRWLLQP